MSNADNKSKLSRQIGMIGAAFLVINGMIGSGIFAMPAKVAVNAGLLSPWLFLLVGLMFLAIVLTFAELASYYGRTGGPVAYATDAYGRFAGFSTGWAMYLSRVTSFAANARLLAEYAGELHGSLASTSAQQVVFVVVTLALVWSNYRGVKQGVWALAVLTVLKLAPMLLLIALGLQEVTGSTLIPPGPFSVTDLGSTALLIAYAYLGFESVSFTAGETDQPKRKIPRALLRTFLSTAVFYFLIVLVFVSVVPSEQAQGAKLVDVGELLAGHVGGVVIGLSALFSISGNLAGIMLTTPRLLFSMAEEQVLPSWFARVHAQRATPHVCILFTGALALSLGLFEGFLVLAAASTVVRLLGYMMCIASLPRIRSRASEQDRAEAFRLPGGILIPALGLGICLWLILQSTASAWQVLAVLLLIGGALFGAGELVRARRRRLDRAVTAPPSPNERAGRPGRSVLWCLAVILAASMLASLTQRAGGDVAVRGFTLPTQNGQWVAGDLFKPATATAASPAPLVIVVPGFQRSKETLSNISLELARRGIVVMAIDPYAQGNSSSSDSRRAATEEGYGMFAVVDYVYDTDNLNYVDKERIAATGHSAGGNAAIRGASHFGKIAAAAGGAPKLHSVYVSGYVLTLTDKVLRDVRSNVGISYALYDEGAYRNARRDGDMRAAPEALRLLASGAADGAAPDVVEIGRYYGDPSEGSLRVVHNEPLLHPFQPYDRSATANQIAFFERAFGIESVIAVTDQVWQFKELLTLVALIAALYMLVPLAQLLLGTAAFRGLVRPIPPAAPRPRGRQRVIFWAVFAASALVACCTYIPMSEWSQELFVAASSREQTWFFPQRMNNAVMMWAACNGVVGFLFFFIARSLSEERVAGLGACGAKTCAAELARSFALAVTLFGAFFGLLVLVYYVFHVDYRFVFLGVRPFRAELLLLLPMYAPLFFVFFLSNSLRVNVAMRFADCSGWRSGLLAAFANSSGLLLILAIQYVVFAVTGTVYWTDGWLYVNLLFGVVPIMFILPYYHRAFFRMTGRIYLGPMTTCMVFITILLSNTVCYLPR